VLKTAVERGREVLRRIGQTTFTSGDRLTVLGGPEDLDEFGQLASSHQRCSADTVK
jgi:Trk K+ transport system NAD-binding subunit